MRPVIKMIILLIVLYLICSPCLTEHVHDPVATTHTHAHTQVDITFSLIILQHVRIQNVTTARRPPHTLTVKRENTLDALLGLNVGRSR